MSSDECFPSFVQQVRQRLFGQKFRSVAKVAGRSQQDSEFWLEQVCLFITLTGEQVHQSDGARHAIGAPRLVPTDPQAEVGAIGVANAHRAVEFLAFEGNVNVRFCVKAVRT